MPEVLEIHGLVNCYSCILDAVPIVPCILWGEAVLTNVLKGFIEVEEKVNPVFRQIIHFLVFIKDSV